MSENKKHQNTKFQEYWLQDPVLKLCTERSESDEEAKCVYCQKTLLAENYMDHVISARHAKRTPEAHKKIIDNLLQKENELKKTVMKTYLDADFNKKQMELQLVNFIVQNHLSFELGDHLSALLAELSKEHLQQFKHITLNSKKISTILSSCLKSALEEKALEDLKENKFGLLLDLGKDHIGCSHLCILARYYKDGEIRQNVLKNVEVKESMTGEKLYDLLEQNILDNELIRKNFIGFSSDNASNFAGDNKGLYGQLKKKYPHVFFQSCMCHNYDLVAEDASATIMEKVIDLIKKISREFAHAINNKKEFEDIQISLQLPIKTPKKWIDSRWLSLGIFLEDFFVQLPAYLKY